MPSFKDTALRGSARKSTLEEALGRFVPTVRRQFAKPVARWHPKFGVVLAPPDGAPQRVPPLSRVREKILRTPAVGSDAAPQYTFVNQGGPVLANVHVFLVFWGSAWNAAPTPSAENITFAVITILDGPYLSGLMQYGIQGNGSLLGTTRVIVADPPRTFTDQDVQTLIVN